MTPSEFTPSPLLRDAQRRARALSRNARHASIFRPRVGRRHARLSQFAAVLEQHEREEFARQESS